jgi:hypothetical protein
MKKAECKIKNYRVKGAKEKNIRIKSLIKPIWHFLWAGDKKSLGGREG